MNDLDSEGLFVKSPGSIRTYSGLRVDPLEMTPEEVSILDIARALSRQCRYNGHVGGFLSVARHSIMVSERLAPLGRQMQLWGLLHDAAEAYLGDLVRPLKHGDFGKLYLEHEAKLEAVIAEHFALPYPMPDEVKEADSYVLNTFELPALGMRDTYRGDPDEDERAFLGAYASIMGGAPKKRTLVIGLTGYARSGKDTAAKTLIEKHDFVRRSFAEKLYGMLLATDPIVPVPTERVGIRVLETRYERLSVVVERIGWEKAKDTIPEVRQLLQRLGTEGVRVHLGETTWIDAAVSDIRTGGRYVFTDVRFENEAEAIRKLGGEVWRVERPGFEPVNSHVSDAGIPDALISRTIKNDGTLADLRRAVNATFAPA